MLRLTFRRSERLASIAGAASALFFAWRSGSDYLAEGHPLAVLYFLTHAAAAALFLIRKPWRLRPAGWRADLVAAGSFLSPYAYNASALDSAGLLPQMLLGAGLMLVLVASVSLGRAYGIFPAVREVRTRYAYRIVRHPMYLSYLLMDSALLLSDASLRNLMVGACATSLLLLRIRYEEELLCAAPEYREYAQKVRWRLIPLVF